MADSFDTLHGFKLALHSDEKQKGKWNGRGKIR